MSFQNRQALILHRIPHGESSFIIKAYTPIGHKSWIAKGARSPKSPWFGLFEPGSVVNAIWQEKPKIDIFFIKECTPLVRALSVEHPAFYLLQSLLEFTLRLPPEAAEPIWFYDFLITSLTWISDKTDRHSEIYLRFLIRFWNHILDHLGWGINSKNCISCGENLNIPLQWNVSEGGFLCSKCMPYLPKNIVGDEELWLSLTRQSLKNSKLSAWMMAEDKIFQFLNFHLPCPIRLHSREWYLQQLKNL